MLATKVLSLRVVENSSVPEDLALERMPSRPHQVEKKEWKPGTSQKVFRRSRLSLEQSRWLGEVKVEEL